jgi:hypothetical protein
MAAERKSLNSKSPMPVHRFNPGLSLLLQSHDYAKELCYDGWEFAVELACLREAGLNNSDLRWLLAKGYVVQSVEVTPPPEGARRACIPVQTLVLDTRSCFVLTADGILFAQRLLAGNDREAAFPHPNRNGHSVAGGPGSQHRNGKMVPAWDSDRRVLRFCGQVVKQFKVPAANQEMILAVFQEENWSPRIDDPLPSHDLIDPKRRLHDTINSLNRNQRVPLLRFLGDGNGQGVCWQALELDQPEPA